MSAQKISPTADSIRVLHVDDDPCLLKISKQILTIDRGFEVDSASSVDEALKKIQATTYDAIVSDYEMPQKDGLQFLKELREQENHTPFILFTGKGREEIAIQALNLGADGYISKQGSPETVYGELTHLLKSTIAHNKAEESLKESEEKFRKIFAASPDACYIGTLNEGVIIEINDSFVDLFGYTREECIGKTSLQLGLYAEGPKGRAKMLFEIKEKGYFRNLETAGRRKNGEVFPVLFSATTLQTNGQKLIVGVLRDITDRKKTEEALLQAKEDWERTFNSLPDCIAILDNHHKIVRINQAMAKQLEVSPEQAIGQNCYECVHGANRPLDFCPHMQTVADGKEHTAEVHEPRLGGEFIVSTSPIKDAQDNIIGSVHVARNITERKKAEEKMKMLSNLFEIATDAIFVIDLEGNLVDFNEATYKQRGYSKEEMSKMSLYDLDSPQAAKQIKSRIKNLLEKGSAVFESEHVLKDGTIMSIEVHARVIESNGKKLILSVNRDITERKKTEETLKKSYAKIEAVNEKLRVVGSLTRHDVRNKLSVINANAYLLKRQIGNDPHLAKHLQEIEASVKASNNLFTFSSIYEKIGAEELNEIKVTDCLNQAITLLPDLDLKIINNCQDLKVTADSMLSQLFYNLIDNSLKHGKTVNQIQLHYTNQDENVKLFYEDNGIGISQENKEKIFTEGFTTSYGTGLGLKIVKKMIQTYGWTIKETGEPGKGARFEIIIPK